MSRKTDNLLGLPPVNHIWKYLLLLWLVLCIVVTGFLSVKSANQLTRQTTITVSVRLPHPLEYNYSYDSGIHDTYVFGVLAFDLLHLLFTLLLMIGSIELHEGLLGSGARGSFALCLISGALLALQKLLYRDELNQATSDYLLFNLVSLIVRNFFSAMLAWPVKRDVSKRNLVAKRVFLSGSNQDINAIPMISMNGGASAPAENGTWLYR